VVVVSLGLASTGILAWHDEAAEGTLGTVVGQPSVASAMEGLLVDISTCSELVCA